MNVIFDLGNVLIAWDLWAAFQGDFETPAAMDAYLQRIGFHDWNYRADQGVPWADLVADLTATLRAAAHPATAYPARHALTIAQPIEGSWQLAARLQDRGHALYALTNWSAETFPEALRLHPRLAMFRDVIVSGREGLAKPDPAIFRLALARWRLAAKETVFIDDNPANVAAAAALGIDALRFTGVEALEAELSGRGLLG